MAWFKLTKPDFNGNDVRIGSAFRAVDLPWENCDAPVVYTVWRGDVPLIEFEGYMADATKALFAEQPGFNGRHHVCGEFHICPPNGVDSIG